ncbi:Lipoxygenase [Hortaea werneckii]|nr:Lipoxygenase [Hortaea werneckii]KAI7185944.1 Lipoxygenase [Hortaea werneckii]KAI7506698.1 Lipoxygenase [Hortaea werneckii]
MGGYHLLSIHSVLLLLLHLTLVNCLVVPRQTTSDNEFTKASQRILDLVDNLHNPDGSPSRNETFPGIHLTTPYTVPQSTLDKVIRSAGITTKRLGFNYGLPLAGGPAYPTGLLGLARIATDLLSFQLDVTPQLVNVALDDTAAALAVADYNGLETLEDYTKLYDGQWENSMPSSNFDGVLTNFTDDRFFSMERLANSPYAVRRLEPGVDSLAFELDEGLAINLTTLTLEKLLNAGRLFYADYRDQKDLQPTARYSAACDAYFYIHPESDDFLPLAIRTNSGGNLIYTPADDFEDWTLAKTMYNVCDIWFAQWDHLARTHETAHIAYMAAIRTLSEEHPVMAILNRLMFEVFAIQPLAAVVLFPVAGAVDQLFAYTGPEAQSYTTNLYANGGSGRFQANYFEQDLRARGLIDASFGPALKHFPFYEDASAINSAIADFMASFVDSYYDSDDQVAEDNELQDWTDEANGPASVLDFPSKISSKETLTEILTHFAHLASVSHHTVNTNELLEVSTTLPMHPDALHAPVPVQKGVENAADYLPPLDKAILQNTIGGLFARPNLVNTDRTIANMFADDNMLARMNEQTRRAATVFRNAMQAQSAKVSERTFDADGLSQGMPFIWRALDPQVAPYSLTT